MNSSVARAGSVTGSGSRCSGSGSGSAVGLSRSRGRSASGGVSSSSPPRISAPGCVRFGVSGGGSPSGFISSASRRIDGLSQILSSFDLIPMLSSCVFLLI